MLYLYTSPAHRKRITFEDTNKHQDMKRILASAWILMCTVCFHGYAQQQADPTAVPKVPIKANEKTLASQWQGKRVAFLGDSMTDTRRIGTTCVLGIPERIAGIRACCIWH